MRRNLAMCTMVVAGLLSWTMLPMGATGLAEAQLEACAERLVGKAFTCEVAAEVEDAGEPLCFQFVSAEPIPTGVGGDFQLNVSPLFTGCPGMISGPLGCNCRAQGNINNPRFDQDKNAFLCTGELEFAIGMIAIVGRLTGPQTLKGDGLLLGTDAGEGESFLFKCQQVD